MHHITARFDIRFFFGLNVSPFSPKRDYSLIFNGREMGRKKNAYTERQFDGMVVDFYRHLKF